VKLIVGLGNPGNKYTKTRHNIGYRVVKKLAEKYSIEFKRSYLTKSLFAKSLVGPEQIMLVLPLTFMNLSGRAISKIAKRNNVALRDILVVHDDIDSLFGKIKIRPSGSDGGHQGLRSIIDTLSSDEFARVKIGIGRPQKKEDVVNYVLSNFSREEEESLIEIIARAVDCCNVWFETGIENAMNEFN
jgi:PTH1 family peptidyl-tRNA hydrolase